MSYLPKAIKLGFKILPSYRAGKIINPAIDKSWYYLPDVVNIFDIPNKFSTIIDLIENEGFGFAALKKLIQCTNESAKPWVTFLKEFQGSSKELQKMIAEWSDADSIGLTIANGIKYFCTKDGSGKKDKKWSVFSNKMKVALNQKYGVEFLTPKELVGIM